MERTYTLIENEKQLHELVDLLDTKEEIAFDWETTGVKFWEDDFLPLGLALAYDTKGGWYIPMNHRLPSAGGLFGAGGSVSTGEAVPSISLELMQKYVHPLLLRKRLVAHNFKFDAQVCARFDMPVWEVSRKGRAYDTYIAAALVNETCSGVSLKGLAREWLGIDAIEIIELDENYDLTEVAIELVAKYAIDDACNTLALKAYTHPKLGKSKALQDVFWKLEMPIIEAVATMEKTGVLIKRDRLREVDDWAQHQMRCALRKLQDISGFPFNPGKSKHVTTMLYDRLGLPPAMKKGQDTTDRKQIEIHFDLLEPKRKQELAPFVKAYLAYKDALKIHTTYAQPIIDLSYKSRIHPSFLQANTTTGRFSSRRPNFQNIPKVGGRLDVRTGLIPDEGCLLLLADYSGVEFLIVSALSKDPTLIKAARDPDFDIHSHTARSIFDLTRDPSTEERDKAKTTVYGVIFGVTEQGLAKQLSTNIYGAGRVIKKFYDLYPGLKRWEEETNAFIMEYGYAQTYFGRRRYGNREKLDHKEAYARESELRQVRNVTVQGTSADITKLALKKCYIALVEKDLRTRIIGQIHDELIFLTPYSEIGIVQALIREHMPYTLYEGKPNEMYLGIDIEIKTSMSKAKSARVSDDVLQTLVSGVTNANPRTGQRKC